MFKTIETERLKIRPMCRQDAEFILSLVNSAGWIKYIGDRKINNIQDSEQYIQKILSNPNYFYHIFELKDTATPIGIVTFLFREDYKYPDIGFAMLPDFENNGYAFEASKKYLDTVCEIESIQKVIAITLPQNTSSIKLLQKLGLYYRETVTEGEEYLFLFEISI